MAAELAARQHAPQIVVDYMSRHPRSVSSASLQQISYRSCAFSLARVECPAGASESVTRAVLVTQGGWLDVGISNLDRLVLGCIRIRIRSRSVFEKKENLGVCAKQKVRLTRLGKYYVVQYYRSQILQLDSKYSVLNTRWKALDKIYMVLHRSDLNVSAKYRRVFNSIQSYKC